MAKAIGKILVEGQNDSIPDITSNNLLREYNTSQDNSKVKGKSKPCRRKQRIIEPGPGINSKSPTIYITAVEKDLLKKFKGYLLLKFGESNSDHEVIMKAFSEYIKNNYRDFYDEHIKSNIR